VAMESTSIYWMPIWHVLEGHFELTLVNPYFIKQLPGRKSDTKDAQWIAECLQKNLIKPSFVAGDVFQRMRQYTRQQTRHIEVVRRFQKFVSLQSRTVNNISPHGHCCCASLSKICILAVANSK